MMMMIMMTIIVILIVVKIAILYQLPVLHQKHLELITFDSDDIPAI